MSWRPLSDEYFCPAPLSLSLLDDMGSVIKTWPLTGKKNYRIGRGPGNDIPLNNTWVSRQHDMLQIEENGSVYALDMGSANGTLVNGQRIVTPTPLRSGDLIQIGGKSTLTFLQNYTVGIPRFAPEDEEQTVAFMTRTQVTVLICDIRGLTTLSEKIGDQRISDIVRIWSQMTNEMVANHHGRIDKFIGDAAMVIWAEGASLRHTVHLALTCASRIATMTTELGNRFGADLPWPLTIGAALNTGEAVIGNIGVDGNRDYTVIGDTVNVAFRLEGLASELDKDLLIGNDTTALLDQKLLAAYFTPCSTRSRARAPR